MVKGIILAGGNATRLYPSTIATSKHLLMVYDKPMIYYPLSILMLSRIQEILIITTTTSLSAYQNILKDGHHLGLSISYLVQNYPRGIADAFIVGERFIDRSQVCLILGDNIFYGHDIPAQIRNAQHNITGATIFGYRVNNPECYGVAEIDSVSNKVISVEEKPQRPKSHYAITGLYFFDNTVVNKAKLVKPSARGELEITAVLEQYLNCNNLAIELFRRGIAWLDTGTADSMLDAANFIAAIEKRQGLKIACLEEIAYRYNYIDKKQLSKLAAMMPDSSYGIYVKTLCKTVDNAS